jgi:hypothetical protein
MKTKVQLFAKKIFSLGKSFFKEIIHILIFGIMYVLLVCIEDYPWPLRVPLLSFILIVAGLAIIISSWLWLLLLLIYLPSTLVCWDRYHTPPHSCLR